MKLLEILKKQIILEVASQKDLMDAIRNKNIIVINYDGDEPGGKGLRELEPVCLGLSKKGNLVLRAWEIEGASHTSTIGKQPLPGWRLFLVPKTFSFNLTGDKFTEARPGYNPNGDKSMTRVYINAKF
jgi:hypothetical protein